MTVKTTYGVEYDPKPSKFKYEGETFKFLQGPDGDKRFEDTVFLVEATSNETHLLWERWATESRWTNPQFEGIDESKRKWEQCNPGCGMLIGYVGGDKNKPVNLSICWNKIDGYKVLFYEVVSRYADHRMVEAWFAKYMPLKWDGGTRRAHCDAANFHHCIHHIDNLIKGTP